jgi:CDK-activating kinase assembly factor MAT1
MQFKVNPECYHKMCSSCIDRIFSSGPAPCPIAGCHRTLRKARFRLQTFADIGVEKEVDKRRYLSRIFNRREEEFETLRHWNDYLEDVETFTFNLLNGVDVEETYAKIKAYESENKQIIELNNDLEAAEHLSAEARQAALKEAARQRREAARRDDELERQEKDELRLSLIDQLASSDGKDAQRVLEENQKVMLKKSSAARKNAQDPSLKEPGLSKAYTLRGIRAPAKVELDKPYDPFGGALPTHKYYTLQDHYEHPWLEEAKTSARITAGGYDVREYYARTMFEAFAGLGVFLADEVDDRDKKTKIEETA